MILQNYYAYLFAKMCTTVNNGVTTPVAVKSLQGNSAYVAFNNTTFALANYSTQTKYLPLVGDSAVDPTIYDYTLNSDRSTDFINLALTYNNTVSVYNGEPCAESIGVISGTNATNDTITIREFGLYSITTNTTGHANEGILWAHEVLESPIEVVPGETFNIPFSLRLF